MIIRALFRLPPASESGHSWGCPRVSWAAAWLRRALSESKLELFQPVATCLTCFCAEILHVYLHMIYILYIDACTWPIRWSACVDFFSLASVPRLKRASARRVLARGGF